MKPTTPTPKIADAKALAKLYGMDGVIVMFRRGDNFGYASYGSTQAECNRMKEFGDKCFQLAIEGGLDGEDCPWSGMLQG